MEGKFQTSSINQLLQWHFNVCQGIKFIPIIRDGLYKKEGETIRDKGDQDRGERLEKY